MKIVVGIFALFCSLVHPLVAQDMGGYTKNYQRALRDGAKVRATVKVISETKEVITNANVRLFFRMTYGKSAGEIIRGTSNAEGIFSAEDRTTDIVFITVEKNGYYTSRTRHVAQSTEAGRLVNGRWLPWNPTIPVVLRKIENPIPMYAMGVDFGKSFPCDEDIGFDCIARDWVAPHGIGNTADFIFRLTATDLPREMEDKLTHLLERQKISTDRSELANIWIELRRIDMAYYKLVLSVPDKDGGFIKKQKLQYSHFVSDHQAPQTGYSQCFTISMGKLPYFEPPNPNDLLGGEYLIFKSRIVRDETGAIVSANYGKIYGPMVHSISRKEREGGVNFRPYFNPVANDRNLEWNGINIATGTKLDDFAP